MCLLRCVSNVDKKKPKRCTFFHFRLWSLIFCCYQRYEDSASKAREAYNAKYKVEKEVNRTRMGLSLCILVLCFVCHDASQTKLPSRKSSVRYTKDN